MGFPCGPAGEESACIAVDLGSIPGLGRSPGEGKGYPLQFSGLEISMDCIVHGEAKSCKGSHVDATANALFQENPCPDYSEYKCMC